MKISAINTFATQIHNNAPKAINKAEKAISSAIQKVQPAFSKKAGMVLLTLAAIATPVTVSTLKPQVVYAAEEEVDHRAKEGSDFYNALLQDGDKYEIEAHYDPGRKGIGSYYQYGNRAFDINGKEIKDPSKLYGFKDYTKSSDTKATSNSSQTTAQPNTVEVKVDHRAKEGSDFYNALLQDGDKYEIEAHYDAGAGGIGSYYQYGNRAFDKNGKEIKDPSKLYGFKKK